MRGKVTADVVRRVSELIAGEYLSEADACRAERVRPEEFRAAVNERPAWVAEVEQARSDAVRGALEELRNAVGAAEVRKWEKIVAALDERFQRGGERAVAGLNIVVQQGRSDAGRDLRVQVVEEGGESLLLSGGGAGGGGKDARRGRKNRSGGAGSG